MSLNRSHVQQRPPIPLPLSRPHSKHESSYKDNSSRPPLQSSRNHTRRNSIRETVNYQNNPATNIPSSSSLSKLNGSDFRNKNQRIKSHAFISDSEVEAVSAEAIKIINQEIYQITNMDPYDIDYYQKKATKGVHSLINNDLLMQIRHASCMRLLLYRMILFYMEECKAKEERESQIRELLSEGIATQLSSGNKHPNGIKNLKDKAILGNGKNYNSRAMEGKSENSPGSPQSELQVLSRLEEEVRQTLEETKHKLGSLLMEIQSVGELRLTPKMFEDIKISYFNAESLLKPSPQRFNDTAKPFDSLDSVFSRLFELLSSTGQHRQQSSKDPSNFTKINPEASKLQSCKSSLKGSRIQERMNHSRNSSQSSDDGNDLLIERLQQIVQNKENRIKELTKQLEKNLSDQKELEEELTRCYELLGEDYQPKSIEANSSKSRKILLETSEVLKHTKDQKSDSYTEDMNDELINRLQEENLEYRLEIEKLKGELTEIKFNQLQVFERERQPSVRERKALSLRTKEVELSISGRAAESEPNSKEWISLIEGTTTVDPFDVMAMENHDISEISPKKPSAKTIVFRGRNAKHTNNKAQEFERGSNAELDHQPTVKKESRPTLNRSQDRSLSYNALSSRKSHQKEKSLSKLKIIGSSGKSQNSIHLNHKNAAGQNIQDTSRDFQRLILMQALTIEQLLMEEASCDD